MNPHPNGIGVTFNWVMFQMLRLRDCDFRVNITKQSNPYREPARGNNVWDYYFDQRPAPGPVVNAPIPDPMWLALSGNYAWGVRHQRAIQPFSERHIRLLPGIRADVDAFVDNNLTGRTLAVHLRGSDKGTEYTPMAESEIVTEIVSLRERLKPDSVFLMTDDADYHRMMQQFGAVSLNIPRSKLSLHHNPPTSRYHSGLWAVMDGFIAARCEWFAYTPSNTATIPLIMGQHQEIHRINRHCVIEHFGRDTERLMGL